MENNGSPRTPRLAVSRPPVAGRRGSTGSLYKLNKNERAAYHHEKEIDETLSVTSLTHIKQAEVSKTDFSKEIRAPKDIKNFVESSEVLLDLTDATLESIIDRMLERMISSGENGETVTMDEIKSSIFADPSRTRLQEKLQGMITKEGKQTCQYHKLRSQSFFSYLIQEWMFGSKLGCAYLSPSQP